MPALLNAYRTLIATAAERKTNRFHFSEPLPSGKEANEYRFTIEHLGIAPFEYAEDVEDCACPEDVAPPSSTNAEMLSNPMWPAFDLAMTLAYTAKPILDAIPANDPASELVTLWLEKFGEFFGAAPANVPA